MPGAEELARKHYEAGVRLRRRTERATQAIWRRAMSVRNLDVSWLSAGPAILNAVTLAQLAAARDADAYTDRVLTQMDIDNDAAGTVNPRMLAGVASDGRDLGSLLYSAVTSTKTAIGRGATESRALLTGQASLRLLVGTQVMDAQRVADGVATTARPHAGGYVRMLSVPSCARCVILAGRFYRWSSGFNRHPLCDCVHVPASENVAGDLRTDPELYFRRLSESEQNKVFGKDGAQAIRDGADISKVVNARRGIYSAGGKRLTREGTARGSQRGTIRPMPEQIYQDATSRQDAIRLLRRFGYII